MTKRPLPRGFTLIEILIVIGIFSVLLAIGLIMSLDSYRGFARRSERDAIVSVLQHARSHAMANSNQTSWGVCYDNSAKEYITFRGTNYSAAATTNEATPASTGAAITGFTLCSLGTGIVFEALTGKLLPQLTPAITEITISVTQNTQTSTVTINNEGRING